MRTHICPALAATALLVLAAPAAAADSGWGLDRIDQRSLPLDGTYRPLSNGAGVTAYLIDTGLDVANPQFAGRASLGANFTGTRVTDCADEQGVSHGTFVAGIVGGNQTGVANRINLVELQALGCTEGGSTMTIRQQRRAVVDALSWIQANAVRPAVVNMSLTFDGSAAVDRAVKRVLASGIPVVAASGNQGEDACQKSPARVPAVITVAASTKRDRVWRGSNQGSCVDIYAPGKDITSVLAAGGVIRYRGVGATSWAAPFVTGAIAQRLQTVPTDTPKQVNRWLRSSATTGALSGVRGAPNRLLYLGAP